MNFNCECCERGFKYKSSFVRHKLRKTPCRKANFSCDECDRSFVSHPSLGKHKLLYCKKRTGQQTPLSDILAKLIDQDAILTNDKPLDDFLDVLDENQPTIPSAVEPLDDFLEVLDENQPAIPQPVAEPLEDKTLSSTTTTTTSSCFDEVLTNWIGQLNALEGGFNTGASSYNEAFHVIDRLLQDGLISTFEHGELYYTTGLFVRLHNIYQMGMVYQLREEYVDILITLFEMKKLNKPAFRYLLLNV